MMGKEPKEITESDEQIRLDVLKHEVLRGLESLQYGRIPYNLEDILEETRQKYEPASHPHTFL